MTKHAKLTNPYAVNQQVIRVAVQSNKLYLLPLRSRAFAGIAARQINAIH